MTHSASHPRVSVGLPVFNGEHFVARAIDSILDQTFRDLELIITDNGSTDRTEQICREYAAKDSRVQYHRSETNRGIVTNFNWPVEIARGEYFHWQAADDSCDPTLIEKCVAVLDADPSVVLAFGRTMMIDESDRPIAPYANDVDADDARTAVRFSRLINLDHHHHCAQEVYGVVRLDALRRTPLYEPNVRTDSILLARLALMGRFRAVDEPLFLNREHVQRSVNLIPGQRSQTRSRLSRWIGVGPIPPAEFWNPSLKGKISFPEWQVLRAYWRSLALAPAGFTERLRCKLVLLKFAVEHAPKLARDVLIAIEHALLGYPRSAARPASATIAPTSP